MHRDDVSPTGELYVKVLRQGRLVDEWRANNLVVDRGRYLLTQLLGGNVLNNSVSLIGFGSNLQTAAAGNLVLSGDAYVKPVDAVTYPLPNQVQFGISLSASEGVGLNLSEYGLLTAGGDLFARLTRSAPLAKDASMSIQAFWTINFGA